MQVHSETMRLEAVHTFAHIHSPPEPSFIYACMLWAHDIDEYIVSKHIRNLSGKSSTYMLL